MKIMKIIITYTDIPNATETPFWEKAGLELTDSGSQSGLD